ncbi:bifunctional phosphoribosylaminoimidazolecarboxamide formyltransferase/IMP cyclohydrolase [Flavobacterium aciduliphilum]|uniref:Bifunctional purine biosynthesis protein PurH n=1 Tax=Flavobacterium aciduliphilum TaxID=1101402 RepID=A0A328YJL1_9FLAO|nr:bifunctional phosphoribosylaminoimidazolecarboxamide formyltransferase/IMP cyclohydrolase [Flavobacterium aciduliphilum]RAR74119.1 phosphoribosylaminoimidazolecarboxamide formyltransferase/IMP cyclohydrolase [Flavobacterium aciduliphilum]
MNTTKRIKTALISVFDKTGLDIIVKELDKNQVTIYSTGGTEKYIKSLGIPVISVEDLTQFPSIFDGRVKTLHPKIFGGILNRQNNSKDEDEMKAHNIPQIDLVIVDLYPFEKTIASGAKEEEIIEKIDIGGISLIRAAAKNYTDTVIIPSMKEYEYFLNVLVENNGCTNLIERKYFATKAFQVSSHYDTAIFNYFNEEDDCFKASFSGGLSLRYGENPHQKGSFFGDFSEIFTKLNGKDLSYNNLLDVDAAVQLMSEFKDCNPTFAILKHNNTCGLATRKTIKEAYLDALKCDPTSAFGGVLIANTTIDTETANEINQLFCEVVIAPSYSDEAISILIQKKNRIVLELKECSFSNRLIRSCLNGVLVQDRDCLTDSEKNINPVTTLLPSDNQINDLVFASKICKHTKSNTIVLAKDNTLLAAGTGQTSRVDALLQAIEKANTFGFDLKNSVMASDAFFPFADCVEIANKAGIKAVIQPGGSLKDQLSIDYCNANNMSMVFTGIRHFKH